MVLLLVLLVFSLSLVTDGDGNAPLPLRPHSRQPRTFRLAKGKVSGRSGQIGSSYQTTLYAKKEIFPWLLNKPYP
jgi:hypothetical protein